MQQVLQRCNCNEGLTILLVEQHFDLKLWLCFEGCLDGSLVIFECFGTVEELAGTTLLHDLCPGIARELTEAIAAVDDGVEGWYLGIPQHKVAICHMQGEKTDVNVCLYQNIMFNLMIIATWNEYKQYW